MLIVFEDYLTEFPLVFAVLDQKTIWIARLLVEEVLISGIASCQVSCGRIETFHMNKPRRNHIFSCLALTSGRLPKQYSLLKLATMGGDDYLTEAAIKVHQSKSEVLPTGPWCPPKWVVSEVVEETTQLPDVEGHAQVRASPSPEATRFHVEVIRK